PPFSLRLPRPPTSPLFPYTTLFRSRVPPELDPRLVPDGVRALLEAQEEDRPAVAQLVLVDDLQGVIADRPADEQDRPERDAAQRSEEHTSELQSLRHLVCRLLLEKK